MTILYYDESQPKEELYKIAKGVKIQYSDMETINYQGAKQNDRVIDEKLCNITKKE